MHTVSTNTVTQAALAHFLSVGRYELHLRHLRKALHTQMLRYAQAVSESFPADMRMTRPQGGFALWIELNKNVNTFKLHKRAMKSNIGFAPGQMFSSSMRFENCLRISCGDPWTDKIEEAIRTLGKMAKEMSKG
jgi:DNA-binding transcriptional MocR family regulator